MRAASDYSSDSAVCFGILRPLRPLRPLREIKDKSDFVFHAKSAKSAEIYSLSCFTLALESTEWHLFHCASQTSGNLKSENLPLIRSTLTV